jgi:hypothetical protein
LGKREGEMKGAEVTRHTLLKLFRALSVEPFKARVVGAILSHLIPNLRLTQGSYSGIVIDARADEEE